MAVLVKRIVDMTAEHVVPWTMVDLDTISSSDVLPCMDIARRKGLQYTISSRWRQPHPKILLKCNFHVKFVHSCTHDHSSKHTRMFKAIQCIVNGQY